MVQSFYDSVLAQIDSTAERICIDPGIAKIIKTSERELTVQIPIVNDEGEIDVFTGYRVQHNSARGPGTQGHFPVEFERKIVAYRARSFNVYQHYPLIVVNL